MSGVAEVSTPKESEASQSPSLAGKDAAAVDVAAAAPSQDEPRKWYRSTLFNAYVIGVVGFIAPGLWNAMNSLGAGGAQKPYLVNAANALVFALSTFEPSFCVSYHEHAAISPTLTRC